MTALKQALQDQALAEGFSAIRISRPDAISGVSDGLDEYLAQDRHGTMQWLEKRRTWRKDPAALWPAAKSIIMLAENYGVDHDPLLDLEKKDQGLISVYARNLDYHDVVKKRLKRLGRWLIEQAPDAEIKVFVDTAPVMEKPLGQAAGLGWQGKHSNLVSREFGSWFFIGSIFTTLDLPADEVEQDHCGSCQNCLDICPTDAFVAPYKLDARKCISYLTIEYDGPVDEALRPALGNRIYGCDDCLAVCPWNKFATIASETAYHARDELQTPSLAMLAQLDDAAFRNLFRKSPIKRIGRNRFIRNVLYAIGNSGNRELLVHAKKLTVDGDAVVQDAARWACGMLEKTQ